VDQCEDRKLHRSSEGLVAAVFYRFSKPTQEQLIWQPANEPPRHDLQLQSGRSPTSNHAAGASLSERTTDYRFGGTIPVSLKRRTELSFVGCAQLGWTKGRFGLSQRKCGMSPTSNAAVVQTLQPGQL